MKVLCIDVGGSSFKYAIIDSDYHLLHKGKIINSFKNKEQFLDAIKKLYLDYGKETDGVSISYCGEVNPDTGEIYSPGSYPYLADTNLKTELEKELNTTVWMEKDAICAGLAEVKIGSLKDYRNCVALTLGTGVGCSIFIEGKPYYGAHNMAGLASISRTIKGELIRKMMKDTIIKKWKGNVCHQKNPEGIDGYAFFQSIERGNIFANQRMNKFTKAIAQFISETQILLDVEAFSIGGGVSEQVKMIEAIQKQVNTIWNGMTIKMTRIKKPDVLVCEFKGDANLIGAMYNFLQRV